MTIENEAQEIRKQLEDEQNNPVKIALFGQPGAGKSSLINSLIGEKKAEVGQRTDVTIEAQIIKWNDLVLVDLPGYGTSKFPEDSYIKKFNLDDYDLFLCVFSGKFHDADSNFFKEIRENGKTALLVRNKCDDIWEEGKTLDELKNDITEDAQKHVNSKEMVYFTSCGRQKIGLDELQKAIYENLDAAKKERWARTSKAYSKEMLEKKREACGKMISKKALMSALNALNPIPGVDIAVNVGIILSLFKEIREDYGLTDEILKDKTLKQYAPFINNILNYGTKSGLLQVLGNVAGKETIAKFSKYIPIVGQVISGGIGYKILIYVGGEYLEDCHKVAEAILEKELEQQ